MKSSFSVYWKDDSPRIIGLFILSSIILFTAYFTIFNDRDAFLSFLGIIIVLYIYYIFHSWYLIGRAYKHGVKGSLLLKMWHNNIQGKRTTAPAIAIILLMQYPIFYGCFLFLLWFSCFLFYAEKLSDKCHIETYFDALYVIIISATTIGFGEIPPVTGIGRAITILSSFFGILIFGVVSASCWYAIQATYVLFLEQDVPNKNKDN